MMRPTIYVAGPMRGYPDFNRAAFNAAAKRLAGEWHILNPVDFERLMPCEDADGTADPRRLDALMSIEREAARLSDAIYLLRGWERSEGARCELAAYLSGPRNNWIVLEGGK